MDLVLSSVMLVPIVWSISTSSLLCVCDCVYFFVFVYLCVIVCICVCLCAGGLTAVNMQFSNSRGGDWSRSNGRDKESTETVAGQFKDKQWFIQRSSNHKQCKSMLVRYFFLRIIFSFLWIMHTYIVKVFWAIKWSLSFEQFSFPLFGWVTPQQKSEQ